MKITLTIDTGNAAFEGDNLYMEAGRIMRDAADRFEDGQTVGTCRDSNGNRVGGWTITGRLADVVKD